MSKTLIWQSCGTEEPGDQTAEAHDGARYEIGPTADGRWSLTRIEPDGEEWPVGSEESEAAVKTWAQGHADPFGGESGPPKYQTINPEQRAILSADLEARRAAAPTVEPPSLDELLAQYDALQGPRRRVESMFQEAEQTSYYGAADEASADLNAKLADLADWLVAAIRRGEAA